MNAATRQALQKKKKMLAASRVGSTSIDIIELRETIKKRISDLLIDSAADKTKIPIGDINKLATSVENALHNLYKAPSGAYKSTFRRLYASIKNPKTKLREKLRSGDLSPDNLVKMTPEQLKSTELRERDEDLKQQGMQNSVAQQMLPENVNQIKDGRDREKWGVGRSAAAIDDD